MAVLLHLTDAYEIDVWFSKTLFSYEEAKED